jgi:GntR family transcriptional regulator, negative regulator for fad regulon and positive regulator of fabA
MAMTRNPTRAFRPREYAEHRLITAILDGTYPPETALPAERAMAETLGITRPTLRETLQRLSREGWIRIRHGKSSVVNDY